jgi:hypothetical protein
MRNPRIKPLSALRPDLPGPLALAVSRALSPDAADRDITAAELAAVVRASLDVDAGHLELRDLLVRWRGSLEKKRARDSTSSGGALGSGHTLDSVSSSSGDRKNPTVRYDEVVDDIDDFPFDGPTVQVQALPGDDASWEGRPTPEPLSFPRVAESVSPMPIASPPEVAVPPSAPVPSLPISLPLPVRAPAPAPAVPPAPERPLFDRYLDQLSERPVRPLWLVALAVGVAGLVWVLLRLILS